MRIAVCISGQVRGVPHHLKEMVKSFEELPGHPHVTYIASVWKTASIKSSGAFPFGVLSRYIDPPILYLVPFTYYQNDFWSYFPVAFDTLQSQRRSVDVEAELIDALGDDAIIDIEPEIMDLEFRETRLDKNSKRMLYKIWRCNEIKKKIERDAGRFDLVLRIRPDLVLRVKPSILKANLGSDRIYLRDPNRHHKFTNDLFAYGASEVIDQSADLFSKSLIEPWIGIHGELWHWLNSGGITEHAASDLRFNGLQREDTKLGAADLRGQDPFTGKVFDMLDRIETEDKQSELKTLAASEQDSGRKTSLQILLSRNQEARGETAAALGSVLRADFSLNERFIHDGGRASCAVNDISRLAFAIGVDTPEKLAEFLGQNAISPVSDAALERLIERINWPG